MTSIRDIARAAGASMATVFAATVSAATVSRVINAIGPAFAGALC